MSPTFSPAELAASLAVPLAGAIAAPAVRRWHARSTLGLPSASLAALSLAVALLWIQAGGMLLGAMHRLTLPWILGWLAAGAVASLLYGRSGPPPRFPDLSGVRLPLVAGAAVVVVLLLEASVPPWFQDDMVYHLSLARAFARAGGYTQPDDNIFLAFPMGWESILAVLHAFGRAPDFFPPINPRLLTVWVAVGAALATGGLARAAGAGRIAAAWCGVALLLVPTFAEFATLDYVEAYLLLLSTLALTFVLRARSGVTGALVPAAALAGATASVKYTGLAICAGLLLVLLPGLDRPRRRRALLIFVGVGALAGADFYVRNWIQRDNPIFPLAWDLFGGRGWDSWRAINYAGILRDYGEGRTWQGYLLLPFRVLASSRTKGGFEASFGPMIIVGAAAAVATAIPRWRRRLFTQPRDAGALALFAALWFAFWAVTTQQGRMLLVAIPPLVALVALVLSKKRVAALVLGLATVAWAVPAYAARWSYQETSGWISHRLDADGILSMLLPDTYPIERALESAVPPAGRVWLVWMHDYTYYLRRDFIEDQVFEDYRFSEALDKAKSPRDFAAVLARLGVTHVLVNHLFFLDEGSADTKPGRTDRLRVRFSEVINAGVLRPILDRRGMTLYEVRAPR